MPGLQRVASGRGYVISSHVALTLRVTRGRGRRGPCAVRKARDGTDRRVHAGVSRRGGHSLAFRKDSITNVLVLLDYVHGGVRVGRNVEIDPANGDHPQVLRIVNALHHDHVRI